MASSNLSMLLSPPYYRLRFRQPSWAWSRAENGSASLCAPSPISYASTDRSAPNSRRSSTAFAPAAASKLAPAAQCDQAERNADPRFFGTTGGMRNARANCHGLVAARRGELQGDLSAHRELDAPHPAAARRQVGYLNR